MMNEGSQTSATDSAAELESEIDDLLASIDDNLKQVSEMMADDESDSDRADRITEQTINTESPSTNQTDPTPAHDSAQIVHETTQTPIPDSSSTPVSESETATENELDQSIDAAVMQAAASVAETTATDISETDDITTTSSTKSHEEPTTEPPDSPATSAVTDTTETNLSSSEPAAESPAPASEAAVSDDEDLAEMLAEAIQEVTRSDEAESHDNIENNINNDTQQISASDEPETQPNIKTETPTQPDIQPETSTTPVKEPAVTEQPNENLEDLDRMLEEAAGQALATDEDEPIRTPPATASTTTDAPHPPAATTTDEDTSPGKPTDKSQPTPAGKPHAPATPSPTPTPDTAPLQRIAQQIKTLLSKIPYRDKPLELTILALSKANQPWESLPADLQLGVKVITASSFLLGALAIFIVWHRTG